MAWQDWIPPEWSEGLEEPDYTELLQVEEKEAADEAAIRETLGVPDPDMLSPEQAQAAMEAQFGGEVDAVSGPQGPVAQPAPDLAQQEPDPAVAQLLDAPPPEQEQAPLSDPYTTAISAPQEFLTPEEEDARALAEELAKSPEQREIERLQRVETELERRDKERAKLEDERAARLEKTRIERKKDTAEARAKYEEKLIEAQKLGEQKIDNDNFWASRSTGQKIAGYLSAAISGWLRPGERNQTVDLIERAIAQDIATQKANLAQQRAGVQMELGIIGKLRALGMQEDDAEDVAELAYYNSAVSTMEADNARFDQRGTTAALKANAIRDMAAVREQKRLDIENRNHERTLKNNKDIRETAKTLQDTAKIREDERHAREQEAMAERASKRSTGLGYAGIQSREDEAVLDRAHALEMEKKKAELSGTSEKMTEAERMAMERGIGGLRDDKGERILFRNPETARELGDKKAQLETANNLLERVKLYREQEGWMSDSVRSGTWRRIKQDWAELSLKKKELAKLGVLTGPDVVLINEALGTDDPTEIRGGVVEAIEGAQRNLKEQFNAEVIAHGSTVDGNDLPPTWEHTLTVPLDVEQQRAVEVATRKKIDDVRSHGASEPRLEVMWQEHQKKYPGDGSGEGGAYTAGDLKKWMAQQEKETTKSRDLAERRVKRGLAVPGLSESPLGKIGEEEFQAEEKWRRDMEKAAGVEE